MIKNKTVTDVVAVVGLGYVGLPLALRAAEVGHHVVGVEVDENKVNALRAGKSYIGDIPDDRIQRAIDSGRFTVRQIRDDGIGGLGEYKRLMVGVITVPTPLKDKEPDLTYVKNAARFLAHHIFPNEGQTIILESTTYPGTTEEVVAEVIRNNSSRRCEPIGEHGYYLGFSPERIDPGNKVHTFESTPKVVSGMGDGALQRVIDFYASMVETVVPVSTPKTAELTKLFENSFAQINIALVNELAMICRTVGVDVDEVLDAASTKGHAFMRWRPGPGVGGHCLPIDPMYLDWHLRDQHGTGFRFASLADEINSNMPHYVAERARHILDGNLAGEKILILGMAYKPGTSDMRESPSFHLAHELIDRGADVTVTDPFVTSMNGFAWMPHSDVQSRVDEFSLVIIATDHDEFDYAAVADSGVLVLDTRNRMARDGHHSGLVHKL